MRDQRVVDTRLCQMLKTYKSFVLFDLIYHFWKSSMNIEQDSRQDPDIIFMQKFMTPSARKCTFKNIESDI